MKTVFHKADSRGHANHGWLDAHHSFSFATWHNPDRMQFGMLRVLNDDTIAAEMGFGTHSHDNMEIITIPLEGDLSHKDSMGNEETIKTGDIQVMSAGTGVRHSEFNPSSTQQTKLLQIWLFPKIKNVTPRYQQIRINKNDCYNKFSQILAPNSIDNNVWIYQDAWFSLGDFDKDTIDNYKINLPQNGVYVFMINGNAVLNGQELATRDAIGIWEATSFDIQISKNTKILLLEVPMEQ